VADPPANGLIVPGHVGHRDDGAGPSAAGRERRVSVSRGVWTNASSRALKERIADLPAARALEAVGRLRPVMFAYKASPGESHVGFIAEDVPELVATADRTSLSAMDIVAVLTKVTQVQQQTISDWRPDWRISTKRSPSWRPDSRISESRLTGQASEGAR